MAYEVVQEVTQPFHGADGIEVLYQPGDRFPADEELPYGVRTRLVPVEVADKPQDKAPAKPAGKATAGKGAS